MLAVEKKDTPSIVKQIVAEQLAHDPKTIDVRQHIKGELGADSMDSIELMMACEDEFGIEIADEEAEKVVTVGDLIHLILTKTEEIKEITPAADLDPLEMPDQDQSHRPVIQMLAERGDYLILDDPRFDLAIVGIAERPGLSAVVYDSEQVILALMERDLMDLDEAIDWFEHNIAGSYLGEGSPLFLDRLGELRGDIIDRLCDILRVPADGLVSEVERMTAALSASGEAIDYQPKRDEPGLYLDSGEFVPASELKGWHGGAL